MGLLDRLFGKGERDLPDADLSVLGTDMHSHFIPGIDDGAQSLEQSMELLVAMRELGYRKVVTTPHCMADGYRNSPEIINEGLEKVRAEVARTGLDIEVAAAAEYYMDHELEQRITTGEVLTFGDRYLLFEMPFISEPQMLLSVIFQMQTQGYRAVLAHPERYAFWYNDFSKYERMKERGVYFQLNLVALSGAYGPQARQIAERMIDTGYYEFLGSDCHNMNHVQAIRNTLKRPYLHKLLASGKLLNPTL